MRNFSQDRTLLLSNENSLLSSNDKLQSTTNGDDDDDDDEEIIYTTMDNTDEFRNIDLNESEKLRIRNSLITSPNGVSGNSSDFLSCYKRNRLFQSANVSDSDESNVLRAYKYFLLLLTFILNVKKNKFFS